MVDKKTLESFNLTFTDYDSAIDKMENHRKEDGARGLQGPFDCMNKYYSHRDSGVTDWTGHPGSGKTYFCLEYLISLSHEYGRRFALYVPDIGNEVDVYDKLFKMFTGFDFHSKYHNQIPENVIRSTMAGIMYRFPLFKKKDRKKGVSPQEMWEYTAAYRDPADQSRLDGCLGDSWKNFKHNYSGREDLYLDEVLSYRNELAEDEKIHIHTIAHAAKTDVDKNGKRRIPGPSDIKGGEAWNANGKNIITVDYPDKSRTGVNIFINKVKPESVGMVGQVVNTIYLDRKKGRYFEFINGLKYYSFKYKRIEESNGEQLELHADEIDSEELPF